MEYKTFLGEKRDTLKRQETIDMTERLFTDPSLDLVWAAHRANQTRYNIYLLEDGLIGLESASGYPIGVTLDVRDIPAMYQQHMIAQREYDKKREAERTSRKQVSWPQSRPSGELLSDPSLKITI